MGIIYRLLHWLCIPTRQNFPQEKQAETPGEKHSTFFKLLVSNQSLIFLLHLFSYLESSVTIPSVYSPSRHSSVVKLFHKAIKYTSTPSQIIFLFHRKQCLITPSAVSQGYHSAFYRPYKESSTCCCYLITFYLIRLCIHQSFFAVPNTVITYFFPNFYCGKIHTKFTNGTVFQYIVQWYCFSIVPWKQEEEAYVLILYGKREQLGKQEMLFNQFGSCREAFSALSDLAEIV